MSLGDTIFVNTHGDTIIVTAQSLPNTTVPSPRVLLLRLAHFCHPKLSEGKVCGFSCHSLLVPWPQSDSNDKFSPTHSLNPTAQGWRSASPTISNAKSEIRHQSDLVSATQLRYTVCPPAFVETATTTPVEELLSLEMLVHCLGGVQTMFRFMRLTK